MSVYRGLCRDGSAVVFVTSGSVVKTCRNLDPIPSQRIRNHNPDGFNWGYGGSGPAQLALAILLDHTADPEKARQNYQKFKGDVVARMPQGQSWEMTDEEIQMWFAGKAGDYFKRKFDGAREVSL